MVAQYTTIKTTFT